MMTSENEEVKSHTLFKENKRAIQIIGKNTRALSKI